MYRTYSLRNWLACQLLKDYIGAKNDFVEKYSLRAILFRIPVFIFSCVGLLGVIQVIAIAGSIYHAGYSNAVSTFATDPERVTFLSTSAAASDRPISCEAVDENEYADNKSRVERVARAIMNSATSLCKQQIRYHEETHARCQRHLQEAAHNIYGRAEIISLLDQIDTSVSAGHDWNSAISRLTGNWIINLTRNTAEINAHVADFVPRRLIIEYGLLRHMNPTDDEIAMILSHELAHCLLGHTTKLTQDIAAAKMLQMVFLSCLDQSGMLSLVLELVSFEVCKIFESFPSRQNEFEADSVGLQLVQLTGYDAARGSEIFLKEAAALAKKTSQGFAWHDSHPASAERYYRLAAQRLANRCPV
jgi:hypothetical protein